MRWYAVWNLACGFATSPGQYLAFRLLAGLGGSAPLSVRSRSVIVSNIGLSYSTTHTHRSEVACLEICSILKKEEKRSRYTLSHRCLDLCLAPFAALGSFILKDDIQDTLLIPTLRIAERSTWRWVVCSFYSARSFQAKLSFQFWSTSIVDLCVQISGLFFLQESARLLSSPSFTKLTTGIKPTRLCFSSARQRKYGRA